MCVCVCAANERWPSKRRVEEVKERPSAKWTWKSDQSNTKVTLVCVCVCVSRIMKYMTCN